MTHKDEEEEEEDDEEDDESVDFLGVEFHSMILLVDDLFHTGSLYNGTKALLGTFCDLGDRQNASVLVEWFPAMLLLLLLLLYYPKALFAVRCSLCWSAGRRRHRSPWKKAVTFSRFRWVQESYLQDSIILIHACIDKVYADRANVGFSGKFAPEGRNPFRTRYVCSRMDEGQTLYFLGIRSLKIL